MPRLRILSRKDKIVRLCLDGAGQYLRKFCTRLVMISYALLMLKPVMPILLDNMAHSLWAKQHYRLVHKHGGKEHVHLQLQKIAKEDAQDSREAKHKFQSETAPHLAATTSAFQVIKHFYSRQIYTEYACSYPVIYAVPDYPPPKA